MASATRQGDGMEVTAKAEREDPQSCTCKAHQRIAFVHLLAHTVLHSVTHANADCPALTCLSMGAEEAF